MNRTTGRRPRDAATTAHSKRTAVTRNIVHSVIDQCTGDPPLDLADYMSWFLDSQAIHTHQLRSAIETAQQDALTSVSAVLNETTASSLLDQKVHLMNRFDTDMRLMKL